MKVKNYTDVVKLRYDQEDLGAKDYSEKNIYSPLHDIGNYSSLIILEILRMYVKLVLKFTGKNIRD